MLLARWHRLHAGALETEPVAETPLQFLQGVDPQVEARSGSTASIAASAAG